MTFLQIKKRFPLCKVDDVLAGFYIPTDGRVNPIDVTMALGKGARMRGVRIAEGVAVKDVLTGTDKSGLRQIFAPRCILTRFKGV